MEELFTHEETQPGHREAFVDVLDAFARSGRVWVIVLCAATSTRDSPTFPSSLR